LQKNQEPNILIQDSPHFDVSANILLLQRCWQQEQINYYLQFNPNYNKRKISNGKCLASGLQLSNCAVITWRSNILSQISKTTGTMSEYVFTLLTQMGLSHPNFAHKRDKTNSAVPKELKRTVLASMRLHNGFKNNCLPEDPALA